MNLCIIEAAYYAEVEVLEDENGPFLHDMDCVVVTVAGVDMDITLEVAVNNEAYRALEAIAINEYHLIKAGER